jgi:hypothetical protein
MQSPTTPLEVTYLRVTSLKPDPRNPRVHTDKQVRQIAQSIESFGFNVPLLIDDQQKVIAGHGGLWPLVDWGGIPYRLFGNLIVKQLTNGAIREITLACECMLMLTDKHSRGPTSSYSDEERTGFEQAIAEAEIATHDLLHLHPSELRLYRDRVSKRESLRHCWVLSLSERVREPSRE